MPNYTHVRMLLLKVANASRKMLSYVDIRFISVKEARKDLFQRLSRVPNEVPALRAALVEGRIDGNSYEGECACFMATVARARGCKYDQIPELAPDISSPTEYWFFGISPGETPKNSGYVAQTVKWIDDWTATVAAETPPAV